MDHEDGDGDVVGIDGGVDGDSGGGMEEPFRGDSGSVSPPLRSSPTVAFCLLFRGFYVSPPPPCTTSRGTIFIVGFRSRRRHGDENGRHRSNEGGERCSHVARESSHMGHPKILLGLPFVRFLGSYALFLPKNDPRKILGHLDVV